MKIENCRGYEQIAVCDLTDIHSKGYILHHKKTGAHISLVSNQDKNKVFYIGFRTPAVDSTGAAHIVEHTVLCGSKRFPAKDPFVELVKGSLNTFLNAITYPDKTVYPVASLNDTDFQNLMHVYLDAVFYPNIYSREEIFQQEGWHYELASKQDPITLNGVVYNEMKGAFSSPEGVLDRQILNSLCPDTSYRYESGGDPREIPKLSYEKFLAFHSRYYHPSNSYIYLYGDMDMEEKLNWLDREYLSRFEHQEIDSAILRQEPFAEPVEVKKSYSIASGEPLEDNTYLSCNFSVDTILNEKLYIAFDVLDYTLLGAPGAPLKQALLDAGIGKDIMSSYDNSIYQPVFSIVAKNSSLEKKAAFLETIETVLSQQVKNGLNRKSLRAALNSFEFKYREADFGQFPKGLLYGLQCLDSWLYDEEKPFTHLSPIRLISWLKEQVDTGYFEDLIETYLLKNKHKSVVIVEPERGLNAKADKELEQKLAEYKASLSPEEIQKLVKDTAHLKAYQEEPSTPEELRSIPVLTREDLTREPEPFVLEERSLCGRKVLYHDLESNGIAYVSMIFDTADVAAADIPYLGILKAVLGYVDTEGYSYSELSNEINLHTGGVSGDVNVYAHLKDEGYDAKFEIQSKALYDKLPKAMELMGEILSATKLSDEKRIYEILAQMKSRLQMTLSSSGHSVSATRAMSYFSPTAKYTDLTGGIAFYRLVSDLEQHYQEKKEALAQKLQELIEVIFRPENLCISLGGRQEGYEKLEQELPGFLEKLWTTPAARHQELLECEKKNEGFLGASQVQYVSRAGNFKQAGFAYTGALRVLKVILSYDYLWLNLRVKGGAYGCMSGFGRRGDSYFSSYRDPNLGKTNEVYEGTVDYLRNFQIDERDMTKYIIGTISSMDTPLTPATQCLRSVSAYFTGLTMEDLQQERNEVLDADENSIRKLADLIDAVLKEQALCVIGNEEKLQEEKELFEKIENLF